LVGEQGEGFKGNTTDQNMKHYETIHCGVTP